MRNDSEAKVIQTIRYFLFFNYPPNFEEIHTFLKKKVTKKGLASILEKMKKKNLVKSYKKQDRYTLGEYGNKIEKRGWRIGNWTVREGHSQSKIQKIRFFLRILSWFPQIQLVGLSGTVAMMNAKEKDDIDLFIVSSKKRLWTARMISLFITQLLGLRRRAGEINARDKVCLNLFMDKSNLLVPKHKQTTYVAHEVLQMKPLINKNFTYEKFLDTNKWVYAIFPNAKKYKPQKMYRNRQNLLGNLLEFCLKKLELTIIKQHQTSEIVNDTQLWFFPEDFEKNIKPD